MIDDLIIERVYERLIEISRKHMYADRPKIASEMRFYHASPRKFKSGDILSGNREGGYGSQHPNVCLTTTPEPHATIAGHISGWSGWRGNWDERYVDDKDDWFVYEVEPLSDPVYVEGNNEYQVKSARVVKMIAKASTLLNKRKGGHSVALPPQKERDRQEKRKLQVQKRLAKLDDI